MYPKLQSVYFKDTVPKIGKKIFLEKELRGHSHNFHIHKSVNDLYISTIIGLPIWLQQNSGPLLRIYKIAHRCTRMNMEAGNKAAQF
jgi:hypothetical protein